MVRKLLKMNMSIDQVVYARDLTKKEVEKIKEEIEYSVDNPSCCDCNPGSVLSINQQISPNLH